MSTNPPMADEDAERDGEDLLHDDASLMPIASL